MRKALMPILMAPVTNLVQRGLTAEYRMDQRNLLKWSEDFSKSEWSKTTVTVEANKAIAPNGEQTASLAISTGESNNLLRGTALVEPNRSYVFSFYVKNNLSSGASYGAYNNSSPSWIIVPTSYFNLINSDTYTRISLTFTAPANCTSVFIYMDAGAPNFNAYLWGAQLELGSTPTDYQKTSDHQTLWNSKKTSLPVQNLVTNGDFSQGVTGWSAGGSVIIESGVATFTGNSANAYIQKISIFPANSKTGNALYVRFKTVSNTLVGSGVIRVGGYGGNDFCSTTLTLTQNSNYASGIASVNGVGTANNLTLYITSGYTSGALVIDDVEIIDLTALFGAGNEPTLAQCDYLFNTWHDGTKVMDLPLYNGQSGSTTGADTNDPTWTGGGLSFTTDDYVKLPYMINAEQDFTVYLVANVGASAPSAEETLIGFGNSSIDTQYMYLSRLIDGRLRIAMRNNAGQNMFSYLDNVQSGLRLLAVKRVGNNIFIKDVISSINSSLIACPSSPITLNQASLGVLLRVGTFGFSNQPEHFASFHTCATTDAEDQRQLRAFKRELLKRGVILGSKSEFYADYVGKVAGSTVENANIAKYYAGTSLILPSSGIEFGSYANISALDGSVSPYPISTNLSMAQMVFSYNIIRDIEDQIQGTIPGSTLAEQIQWCKDNMSSNTLFNWYGRGTNPTGNKATIALWNVVGGSWNAISPSTSGVIAKNTLNVWSLSSSCSSFIDVNGFMHLLAYADPSDGVTASTIYTDKPDILIKLKAGVVLV